MKKKISFKEKLRNFMRGRYGTDTLNKALMWAYFAFLLIMLIVVPLSGSKVFATVIRILSPLIPVIIIARTFSRNIAKRQRENKAFCEFFKRLRNRFRDRKTHVYRKCPACRATLRLPRSKGKHKVTCPRCKKGFSVRGKGIF